MFSTKKPTYISPFATFISEASSGEKKRVFLRVLEKATERQKRILSEAEAKKLVTL